jgi:hypothetical protein
VANQRQVVVVNQQNRDSCGCGSCLGVFILLALLGALLGAMQGEYGLAWQFGSIAGVVVVALLLVVGLVAWLDQKLGWGLFEPPDEDPPTGVRRDPQDIIDETENYGAATPDRTSPSQPRLASPVPHPDDPRTEEQEETGTLKPPTTGETVTPNIYEQIRRLAKLRDEGLITTEEFEEKKRELLDRL